MLVHELGTQFDCVKCPRAQQCENGGVYAESNPYRFEKYKHIAFEFCPQQALNDPEAQAYYMQVSALRFGINTFGDLLTFEELDALLMVNQIHARLKEERYFEFWAKAFAPSGGKK